MARFEEPAVRLSRTPPLTPLFTTSLHQWREEYQWEFNSSTRTDVLAEAFPHLSVAPDVVRSLSSYRPDARCLSLLLAKHAHGATEDVVVVFPRCETQSSVGTSGEW